MLVITTTKGGLTIFDYIKAMTDGGPAQATEAIGILIYRHAMSEGKFCTVCGRVHDPLCDCGHRLLRHHQADEQ